MSFEDKSARDEAEEAAIRAILEKFTKRIRGDVVRIGIRLIGHFARKDIAHGKFSAYCLRTFKYEGEYIRRFMRVGEAHQSGLLLQADNWQSETGWINPYQLEPARSNNLLFKFAHAKRNGPTTTGTTRNTITPQTEAGTDAEVLIGDCRKILLGLPDEFVQAVVTSPPYHASRDFLHEDQIGHEPTSTDYIATLVQDVFRPLKRVLKDDGLLFVNLGDRTADGARGAKSGWAKDLRPAKGRDELAKGNLLMIPARFAIAMQNDGWILRSEIIWSKNSLAMAASRRPPVGHEMVYMFSKNLRYKYHPEGAQEPTAYPRLVGPKQRRLGMSPVEKLFRAIGTVWEIGHVNQSDQGIAPYPVTLAERCILLSTVAGDRVLDPFSGTGTTAVAALKNGRKATLIELNPEFAKAAEARIARDTVKPDDQDEAAD
jgi:DNA modification methylase